MKNCWLFLFLLPLKIFAQSEVRTVKAEQQVNEVFSVKDIFRYENFTNGKVLFKDGTTAEARFNYNRLFEQMLFINSAGDTLAIAAPELTQVITIGKDSFYYCKEFFVEQEPLSGPVKMATRQVLKEIDKKTLGGYGSTVSDAANSSFKQQYTIDGKPIQMKPGEGTLFSKTTEIFISDEFAHFVPLSKKSLESLYFKKSNEVREFMKTNHTNLKRMDDVKSLLSFANQLR